MIDCAACQRCSAGMNCAGLTHPVLRPGDHVVGTPMYFAPEQVTCPISRLRARYAVCGTDMAHAATRPGRGRT
eukprot:2095906-Rhodomonas_salina.4